MSTSKFAIDGLWRCLCPSTEYSSVNLIRKNSRCSPRAFKPWLDQQSGGVQPQSIKKRLNSTNSVRYTSPTGGRYEEARREQNIEPKKDVLMFVKAKQPRTSTPPPADPPVHPPFNPSKVPDSPTELALEEKFLHNVPLDHLKARALTAAKIGNYKHVCAILNYLLTIRGEEPTLWHYNIMVLANTSPQNGSAEHLVGLVQEMEEKGILPDIYFIENALTALSIHPHPLLRASLMHTLDERWLQLTTSGSVSLLLCLLRENQYEIFLQYLLTILPTTPNLPPYILDLAVFILLPISPPLVLQLLHHITKYLPNPHLLSPTIYSLLLSASARTLFHPGVQYAWRHSVEPNHLNPSDGTCLLALHSCARTGDAELATDIFRVLGNRKVLFERWHYEALMDAYIQAGEIRTVCVIACLMRKAGVELQVSGSRSLVKWLRSGEGEERCKETLDVLRSLKRDERKSVPELLVRCVAEAMVARHGHGPADAMQILRDYKHYIDDSGAL